jgi:hypothetical protein
MSTPTIDRLKWIMSQLVNLNNGGNIRYEGNATFQGAYDELADVIRVYVDNSAAPAPVVLQAMTPEQVDAVLARIVATSDGIVSAVGAHIEQSDLAVLDALAHTRADVLAAVATPAAQ